MIVDMRIYTIRPGKTAEFLAFYEAHGWAIQQRHLGRCLGYYATVEGALNTIVHLWAYDDQADRERRRAGMAADPEWQSYLKRANEMGFLEAQENRFLRPAAFSPK